MTTFSNLAVNYFPIVVELEVKPPSTNASHIDLIEQSDRFGIELCYTEHTNSNSTVLIQQKFGRSNHNRKYSFTMTIKPSIVKKAAGIVARTVFFESQVDQPFSFYSSTNTTQPVSSKLLFLEKQSFDFGVSPIDTKRIKFLIDFTAQEEDGFVPLLDEYV